MRLLPWPILLYWHRSSNSNTLKIILGLNPGQWYDKEPVSETETISTMPQVLSQKLSLQREVCVQLMLFTPDWTQCIQSHSALAHWPRLSPTPPLSPTLEIKQDQIVQSAKVPKTSDQQLWSTAIASKKYQKVTKSSEKYWKVLKKYWKSTEKVLKSTEKYRKVLKST